MALNIKNAEVERLAAEVAELARETKTEAIRRALEERKNRLGLHPVELKRGQKVRRQLELEVWPYLPAEILGKRLSKEEEEEILGFGPEGV
jgi:antitoxin VapB